MDDDLLADDGQFKDDGLDELDIDEEAALLGLSDEEIESERLTANKDLEYVDEDGNPVEIGENNAGLYEVAKYHSNANRGTPTEDDVLDLDLDAELESFTEENPDLLRESPAKTFNDRQCMDNLISLTSRNIPTSKRQEPRYSPDRNISRVKVESSFSGPSSRKVSVESLNIKMEFDEESEDEDDDDHRERFKSERSNIITLTPAKNRNIPDTLESVINEEETAKVQAFLENEQKRKMRYRGRDSHRMKGPMRQNRPAQSFPSVQHQPLQFSSPAPSQQQPYQHGPSQSSSQPRKILINPHFRGVRQPPPSETAMMPNQSQQVTAPPVSYNPPQNFASPVSYSQDHSHQVNIAPPPAFSAPPPTMPYNHPEYPPPQQPIHIQQAPPPVWQTPPQPEMHPPPVSYANPPPPLNYGDHMSHNPPGYHNNYSPNSYQNAAYSPPQMPPPQMAPPPNMNYNQPPPSVHMHPPSHALGAFPPSAQSPNVPQMHFKATPPVQRQNVQQKSYQDQRNVNQASHSFQRNTNHQNLPFNRVPEKRPSNVNMKQIPKKQARPDHPPRKNLHVNNSNIREIPLVDTIKKEPLVVPIKKELSKPSVVEEEDEKTKELRMKIEEQKLLREQILKRKEERRRQMAAQRLMDLQKRQSEQNQTINVVTVPRVEQKTPIQAPIKTDVKPKMSVKQRIGVPVSGPIVKKKVIVVRKKAIPPSKNAAPAQQNRVVGMAQRLGNQPLNQQQQPPQKLQPQKKTPITAPTSQTVQIKTEPVAKVAPNTNPPKQPIALKKINAPNKTLAKVAANKILAKSKPYARLTNVAQQRQKGHILQRLGNKGNFNHRLNFNHPQHQQGSRPPQSPRFNGPRPPFMEHRMRFPGPMNDLRPSFQDQRPPPFEQRPAPPFDQRPSPFEHRPTPFQQRPHHFEQRPPIFEDGPPPFHDQRPPIFENQRPPLLPFHPHEEGPPFNQFMFEPDRPRFHMQGGRFDDFHPMRMERMDRFPRPQFPNQMARPQFEPNNGPMFQRPQFSAAHPRPRINNQQKKIVIKSSPKKTSPASSPAKAAVTVKKEITEDCASAQTLSQQVTSNSPVDSKRFSVCVENLSSSTSEMQLKKLCSSVGVVENIHLIKSDRKAVIKFKETSQALNFQKKYQRHMLDLAMIQVTLTST